MSSILCDATILAGGKGDKLGTSLPNKTFIRIRNRPLFMHVLHALLEVKRIGRIFLAGPKMEIEAELAGSDRPIPEGRVLVTQEHSNIVENVWYTFLQSLEGYRPGDENTNEKIKEKPILVTGGDSPLMTPMEVDEFLDRCVELEKYDYFLGMTPKSALDYYIPRKEKPGITMAYSHFAEDFLRINNLHLVKPFKIKNRIEFFEFYKVRELRKIYNVAQCGISLIKRQLDWDGLFGCLGLYLAMHLRKIGFSYLSDLVAGKVPIKRIERVIDRLVGTRSKLVVTTYGGCALDVDRKGNPEAIEEMYDDWMGHQQSIYEKSRGG